MSERSGPGSGGMGSAAGGKTDGREGCFGSLIAMEGIDAVGKSTQARLLAKERGAELTFQFGATEIGAAIRELLLNPANAHLDPRAEAMLVIADKAQHVTEIVLPSLRRGRDVVTDRYTASTLAYQGYGRRLDLEALTAMLDFATGGLSPDLTVLLDIDPVHARSRLTPRTDRIEKSMASDPFVKRVRQGYLEMAAVDADRWVVVDAHGSIDEVAARIKEAVRERMP